MSTACVAWRQGGLVWVGLGWFKSSFEYLLDTPKKGVSGSMGDMNTHMWRYGHSFATGLFIPFMQIEKEM